MCSKAFGKSGLGAILGDVIGAVGGFALGGPIGAAIGGGLGGFAGNAASGGKGIGSDLLAGLGGAALGFGGGELASAAGLGSLGGLGADAAGAAGSALPLPPNVPGFDALGNAVSAGASAGSVAPAAAGALPADLTSVVSQDAATAGGAAASAAPAAGDAAGGAGSFLNKMIPNGNTIIPAALSGIGLARNLTQQNNIPGVSQLTAAAGQLAGNANLYSQYLATGTLPPGAQAAIDQATQAAIAGVKGKFASMGQTGSTQEQQEIATLTQNAAAGAGQVATQLLSQGLSMANLSDNIYQFLVGNNTTLNNQTSQAIANLSAAMAGGYRTGGQGGGTYIPNA